MRIIFAYYYKNSIIFILFEVHAFERRVRNMGFTFKKGGVHIFGKGGSNEPPEPPPGLDKTPWHVVWSEPRELSVHI